MSVCRSHARVQCVRRAPQALVEKTDALVRVVLLSADGTSPIDVASRLARGDDETARTAQRLLNVICAHPADDGVWGAYLASVGLLE